jgi:hypothetical protein
MSEVLCRAAIPTNSLYLIEREAGEIVSPLIQYIYASSAVSTPSVKETPHRYIRIYNTSSRKTELKFNRGKSRNVIELGEIVQILSDEEIHDLWVHDIKLRIKNNGDEFDYCFKNAPLTEGSQAAWWVQKYLNEMKISGWMEKTHLRHLPLIEVVSVPSGASMSPYETSSPPFIAWLGKVTGGLVKMKTIRRVEENVFVDLDFKNMEIMEAVVHV